MSRKHFLGKYVMSLERFKFSLEQIEGAQWARFERLCSIFLASELPASRTMASPGGDGGRDAELYSDASASTVMFQFSLRVDWEAKLKQTLKRVQDKFPETICLVYMTNKTIGAKADALKADFRAQGVFLDIRDQNWFLERCFLNATNEHEAQYFSNDIATPILDSRNLVKVSPKALGDAEARSALFYLEIQSKDMDKNKGLTKASFDALVQAAAHGTNLENKIKRSDIDAFIFKALPRHEKDTLVKYIVKALDRLKKRNIVKHWPKTDEYHISHEHSEVIKDSSASIGLLKRAFEENIIRFMGSNGVDYIDETSFVGFVLASVEGYFYKIGEVFARSVANNIDIPIDRTALIDSIMVAVNGAVVFKGKNLVGNIQSCVEGILSNPSSEVRSYLSILSSAYTIFAILSEVPDVQKAVGNLFKSGEFWMDTTVLLPVFAEQALASEDRLFTKLFKRMKEAGNRILVTEGILTEIYTHLNLSRNYMGSTSWQGRVPYVAASYILSGRAREKFNFWCEEFHGSHKPEEDIFNFLKDEIGAELRRPEDERLSGEIKKAVKAYWDEVHFKRRTENYNQHATALSRHDAECYLSVLSARLGENKASPFGYANWLVSLDQHAWKAYNSVSSAFESEIKHNPVISIDFLINYMALGPSRGISSVNDDFSRVFMPAIYENLPSDIVQVADDIRKNNPNRSTKVISRMIRDGLDAKRATYGDIMKSDFDQVSKVINDVHF